MSTRNFFDLKFPKTTPGKVIRAFRKNFNITQQELAEVTGIAETNLSAIENDKVEIGVKRAVQVASAKMMAKKKVG
ncbi:MAG: helix-turn-helix transcriptional regulator [Bdellovibrionota bacterium]